MPNHMGRIKAHMKQLRLDLTTAPSEEERLVAVMIHASRLARVEGFHIETGGLGQKDRYLSELARATAAAALWAQILEPGITDDEILAEADTATEPAWDPQESQTMPTPAGRTAPGSHGLTKMHILRTEAKAEGKPPDPSLKKALRQNLLRAVRSGLIAADRGQGKITSNDADPIR